jgi:hypothetical protein
MARIKRCVLVVVMGAALFFSPSGQGQTVQEPDGSTHTFKRGAFEHDPTHTERTSESPTRPDPGPYGGQIFCPVSGAKLGLQQAAVPVQTSIGEEKPGFFARLFGQKGTPGVVIYACCPECAEKIRNDPHKYYRQVVIDMSNYLHGYERAPAQRPDPEPTGQASCPAPLR